MLYVLLEGCMSCFLLLDGLARLWMLICRHNEPSFPFIFQPSLLYIILVTALLHNTVAAA